MVDIGLTAPRRFFPQLGKFSIRAQLLLQVVVITLIAFSVSFFSVWELYDIRASFDQVRASLGPAKSALQLAKELEHIYGLAQAHQLSFNQPEQRQTISAEINEEIGKLVEHQKEVLSYSEPDFAAGIHSFLRIVEDARKTSDQFTKVFEARRELVSRENKIAAEATSRFRQSANNETTLLRSNALTQIAEQIQNMRNALMRVLSQPQFEISRDSGDVISAQLEQVAGNERKTIDVLTHSRTDLISRYRQQLDVAFAEFSAARDSLQTVLAGGAVLSGEETAELRTAAP